MLQFESSFLIGGDVDVTEVMFHAPLLGGHVEGEFGHRASGMEQSSSDGDP